MSSLNRKFKKNKPPRVHRLHCTKKWKKLRQRCLCSFEDYFLEGDVYDTPDGKYIFKDNGAKILAVAHLDTVQNCGHFGLLHNDPHRIYCSQLDDRLGAYTILDKLPSMGIKMDVLLTDGEESCRSTARHFISIKDYNWIVEFDRGGTDVVMYQYETQDLQDILEVEGNEVGVGCYSDIADLDFLGVAGFNWGVGYYNYHLPNAYFVISEYRKAIKRFVRFYKKYKDIKFDYIEQEQYSYYHSHYIATNDYEPAWIKDENGNWIRNPKDEYNSYLDDETKEIMEFHEKQEEKEWSHKPLNPNLSFEEEKEWEEWEESWEDYCNKNPEKTDITDKSYSDRFECEDCGEPYYYCRCENYLKKMDRYKVSPDASL